MKAQHSLADFIDFDFAQALHATGFNRHAAAWIRLTVLLCHFVTSEGCRGSGVGFSIGLSQPPLSNWISHCLTASISLVPLPVFGPAVFGFLGVLCLLCWTEHWIFFWRWISTYLSLCVAFVPENRVDFSRKTTRALSWIWVCGLGLGVCVCALDLRFPSFV